MTKQMIITAGLPAAGKSHTIKQTEFNMLPVVDPDAEKLSIKGYDPKNPMLVHTESKQLARAKHLMHLSLGESFIVDGTGTNVEKYIQWINEAREMNYEVILLYVQVSIETSIARNAKRERNVPVNVITAKANIIDQSTKMIGGICDKFITINND